MAIEKLKINCKTQI